MRLSECRGDNKLVGHNFANGRNKAVDGGASFRTLAVMVPPEPAKHELVILRSGHVSVRETADSQSASLLPADDAKELVQAFRKSQAEGLFLLASRVVQPGQSAALGFWRDFGGRHLTLVCQNVAGSGQRLEAVAVPTDDVLAEIIAGAPPIPGAEYLDCTTLSAAWCALDEWVRQRVAEHRDGLAGFLKKWAPLWHQVGRVCFHLAENRRDPLFPFAFLATYSPGVSGGAKVKYQPLSKALQEFAGAHNKEGLIGLLSPVERASRESKMVRELVESGDLYHPLLWSASEAHQFLTEVPLYEASGLLVRLPDWWKTRSRPQVSVTIGEKRKEVLGADAMLDFRVSLALGDEILTDLEWEELMAADDGLVLLKGRWVEVDREKLAAALEHWQSVEAAARHGELSFVEGMRLLAGAPANLADETEQAVDDREWAFIRPGEWLKTTLEQLRNPEQIEGPKNDGLQANLRPYQTAGVDWLWMMAGLGLGACLADDMGLGKTIQVLALLLRRKAKKNKAAQRPSLLVLPASLLANWKDELARFAPSLRAMIIHPAELDKEAIAAIAAAPDKSLQKIDVVLTSYGMLQRQAWLADLAWQLVVLDEAQAIKNPSSRQTRTVKKLQAEARIALTGTPVENRLADLWSLFDFLCPGLLGSAATFKKFVKSLDGSYAPVRKLVQPYLLRRLKTDKSVISDLPDKTEVTAFCGLSKRQAALYQATVNEMAEAMEGQDGIKRRGLVLAFLMRFKQICNHPSQFFNDGEYQPTESGKFQRLAEICDEIASRQEKVLVFTQFREMTQPLNAFLTQLFGTAGLVLHGGTAVGKRKKLVDQFQSEGGPPFFILSLKAGGTGLNLTAATQVIHFDRWWNPAVENQATDRAFRIGQKRNVLVHKFVCRGTIETRIDDLIRDKQALAKGLLGGDGAEKMLTELSDDDLLKLVALDVNRAMA